MKYIYNTLIIMVIGVVLTSCSSTNTLTLSVTEPAPIYVPSSIKKIGVIDRSLPKDQNIKMDNIEKILSAEGKNLDKDGANEAVNALFDELTNNKRFSDIKLIVDPNIKSPGLGIYPSKLSWSTIEKLCKENDVDAIFALSFYDTDTKIDYKSIPVEITGPLGVKIPGLEHHVTIATLIKTGWRIYDSASKIVIDEYAMNDNIVVKGVGINPVKAVEAVLGRKEAVLRASNKIGQKYVLRILPYRRRVSRRYYVRGTNNFEVGKRRAQTGNWDGAADLWKKDIEHPKAKIAGRACYNMAIINEINGDLDKATEWASKSYTDYENKLALQYLNIIKRRIRKNQQLVQEQN